jgi:hypothetical protein
MKEMEMLIDAQLNDFEDFGPIQVGTYDFAIKEPVEVIPTADEKTDIGGKQYTFIIRPEIVGGASAGKKARIRLSNKSKASRYFLKSFLEKVGCAIQGSGAFASEDLLGLQFRASVGERMGTGENAGKKYADLDTESVIAL